MFDSHHGGFGIIKKSFQKQRYLVLKDKVKAEKEEFHTGSVEKGCAKAPREGAMGNNWRLKGHPTWGRRGREGWKK